MKLIHIVCDKCGGTFPQKLTLDVSRKLNHSEFIPMVLSNPLIDLTFGFYFEIHSHIIEGSLTEETYEVDTHDTHVCLKCLRDTISSHIDSLEKNI